MLTFFTDDGVIFGLTQANLDRLPTEPIMISYPNGKVVRHLAIIYGKDKPDIIAKLESHGIEIPQVVKDDALDDPL